MVKTIESSARPDALLGWMEALADPTRLRLLRLLERQELGVIELCDVLQLPQSTVSRHLKVLADQGWCRSHRRGTTHLYRTLLDELEAPARKLWVLAREQTANWAAVRQDALRLERRLRERTDGESFFDSAAGQWDKLRGELYGHHFTRAALTALLPSDFVVADLGCGAGTVAAELSPCVKTVIAVDNSAAMLRAARKRVAGATNVDFRRGDLAALPIAEGACDAALMLLALTYVPKPDAAVRELARILKPGGRAVIVDLLPHDRDDFRRELGQQHAGFEMKQLEHWMSEAGLPGASVRPLPPEPAAKGPALFLAVATGNNIQ